MQNEPWKHETDRKEWKSEHGFQCLIVRGEAHKALCGYVGVEPGHPWHGKNYNDIDAHAHGGLTYSDACQGNICHKPVEGEPEHLWWIGFDCVHSGDLAPGFASCLFGEYRDMKYVTRECEELAEQAKNALVVA